MSEHLEQKALIQWANLNLKIYPELSLLFAIGNSGHRSPITGARLKEEGVRAGVPDLCLPVARGPYGSLFIEMKRRMGGIVSPQQRKWIKALREAGNKVEVCAGFIAARDEIIEYLEGAK